MVVIQDYKLYVTLTGYDIVSRALREDIITRLEAANTYVIQQLAMAEQVRDCDILFYFSL